MQTQRSNQWPGGVLALLLALALPLGSLAPGSAASRPAPAQHARPIPHQVNTALYGLSIPNNDGSGVMPSPPGWKFLPFSTWRDLGATWVRIELDTTPLGGSLDASKALRYYHNMLHNLHAAGLKVMALIDYETLANDYDSQHHLYPWQCFIQQYHPKIKCTGFDGTPQEYINDFTRQATLLANLGADAPDAYEIWNGPDGANFYIPAATYTDLYTSVQTAVHALTPSATVVTGGLNTPADQANPGMPGSWTSQAAVYSTADAAGINAYTYVSQNYCGCYWTSGWLDGLKSNWDAFLKSRGNPNARVWFTEYNITWHRGINNNVKRALGIEDVYSWAKINNVPVFWYHGQDYYNPDKIKITYSGLYHMDGTLAALDSPVVCGAPQTTEVGVYQASVAGLC